MALRLGIGCLSCMGPSRSVLNERVLFLCFGNLLLPGWVLCFSWGEVLLLLFWIRVLLYRDQSGLETTMQPRLSSNSRQPSFLSLPSAGISHHIWFFVLVWFGFWDSNPSYTPTQNLLPTSRMLRLQACFTMIKKKTPGLFIYLHWFCFLLCFVWRVWLGVSGGQPTICSISSVLPTCMFPGTKFRLWILVASPPTHWATSLVLCFSFVLFSSISSSSSITITLKFCFLVGIKHKALGFEAFYPLSIHHA